jgi:hypothetical protein
MDKVYGIIVLLFLMTLNAKAQNDKWMVYPSVGFEMGGTIPIPLSDIPDDSKISPHITLSFGGGIEYVVTNRIHFAVEANYHQLGFSAKANVISQSFYFDNHLDVLYFSGNTDTRVKLRFLEFPFMLHYKTGKAGALSVGFFYSLILDGTFDTRGNNGVLSNDKNITDNAQLPGPANTRYNFNDFLENWDLGLQLGYRHRIQKHFVVWGNIKAGFNSIFEDSFDNIDYEMYQVRLNLGTSFYVF